MIFAIDTTNWVHVLYHALRGQNVADAVMRRLDAIEATWDVTRLVCAFDRSPTFRHELQPDYKAGRTEKDDELIRSLHDVEKACRHRPDVLTIAENLYEADDILATVARISREAGQQCVLVTPDKDAHQLLRQGRVTQLKSWNLDRGVMRPLWMTANKLRASSGVSYYQWIDYQCLVGDAGDNIAGVPGVGKKTAVALLNKHTTLAAILADPYKCKVSTRVRDSLFAFRDRVDVVRRLVTLHDRVPWVVDALDLDGPELVGANGELVA